MKKKTGLEFEIELKKEAIVYFGEYLFSNQLGDLENILLKEFYKRFSNLLVLNTSYTDWLLVGCRKISKLDVHPLVTSYMGNSLQCEKEYLMKLIQFLSFLKNLKGYKKYFFDEAYYLIEFDVFEFLNFLNIVEVSKGKRQNQLMKTVDFLKSLQKLDPVITNFSETFFRSCVIFPYLSVEKRVSSGV